MAIIKASEFKQEFAERVASKYKRAIADRVVTVFLSHSHWDDDLIASAQAMLEEHNAEVYRDTCDSTMPTKTCSETASRIKEAIVDRNKFIVLASDKAVKESRWVPWELGYADGKLPLNKIAIIPVLSENNNTGWPGSEYVGLYHSIVKTSGEWRVSAPGSYDFNFDSVPLREWLSK